VYHHPPVDLGIDGLLYVRDIDGLDHCWALDLHSSRGQRTRAGQLVYDGKHYGDKPGDRAAAETLGDCLGWWYRELSSIDRFRVDLDLVVPVPSTRQRRPHNLPTVLGRRLGMALHLPCDPTKLIIERRVDEM
jgi:hypothetical protein